MQFLMVSGTPRAASEAYCSPSNWRQAEHLGRWFVIKDASSLVNNPVDRSGARILNCLACRRPIFSVPVITWSTPARGADDELRGEPDRLGHLRRIVETPH